MLKIYRNQIIVGIISLVNPLFQLQLYADESAPLEQAAPWFSLQNNLDLPDWIQFSLQTQAEPMLNPSGGTKQTRNWIQQTVGSIAIGSGLKKETKLWSEIDHWRLDTSVNFYNGNPNFNSEIGAYIPLQQVAHESGFWLTQATLSRSSGDGLLGIKGGILSINPDFIYSPIYDYYIHSSLNNTLNLSINDMPVNPLAAIGGVVELKPGRDLSMRYGLFDLASTRPIATSLGDKPQSNIGGDGLVQLLQVSYSPQWLAPAKPGSQLPPGALQLGGYSTNNDKDGSGINGSFNFSTGLALGLDHRFWIGSNYSFNSSNNTTPTFISVGFLSQAILTSRPFDVLILGFGRSGFSPTIAAGQSYEGVIELGYQ